MGRNKFGDGDSDSVKKSRIWFWQSTQVKNFRKKNDTIDCDNAAGKTLNLRTEK